MEHTWTAEEQKAHRKLWVEALRSGKYDQARSQLRNEAGAMCCLGVACEISGLGAFTETSTFIDADYDPANIDPSDSAFKSLVSDEYATISVQRWLGLRTNEGRYELPDSAYTASLAEENDDGKTFEEIAEIIEAEPDGLLALAKATA